MTLRLHIYGVNSSQLINKKLRIEVQGSKAGNLLSSPSDGPRPEWKPSFRIDCSDQDNLNFILYQNWQSVKKEVASTSLNCATFVKREKQHLKENQLAKYELDLRINGGIIGVLRLEIGYDPSLLFQGEMPQKLNLSLKLKQPNFNFYAGKCETVNAFSFLDQGAVGQKCVFKQNLYRVQQ